MHAKAALQKGGAATGKAGNGKRDGNGSGKRERETGNENLREAAGAETTRSSRLLSSREPGRVGLRTHGSLTLFMSRTRENCGGRVRQSTRSSSE